MSSNKHIVMLVPGFAKDAADENCTPYLQEYFKALAAARPDWTIQIIAFQYPFQSGSYNWNGLQVHALGGKNKFWRKHLIWRKAKKLIRQLHLQQPIDVLHSFWLGEVGQVAMKMSEKLEIKWLATAMGQDCKSDNPYLRKLDPNKAHARTAMSLRATNLLSTNWKSADVEYVFWGLSRREGSHEEREIDVLGVGSLIPLKRWDRFIRVVSLLRERHPHLRAMIIGGGPQEAELKKLRDSLALGNNIEIVSEMPRSKVLDWMARSKVLLHCSDYEGMGYGMVEAYQAGAHIVSTEVGIAEPKEKWAVAAHTYGLAEAVDAFLRNPVDTAFRNDFDVAQTVAAYLKIYSAE